MFEKLHFREKVRLDCFPRIRMEKFRIRILNHIENFRIQDQDPYNNSYDQSHSFNFIYSNFFTLHSTIKLLNTRITTQHQQNANTMPQPRTQNGAQG